MMLKRIRTLLRGGRKSPAPEGAAEAPPPHPQVHRGPQVVHRPIPPSDLDTDAVKIVQRLTRFDHRAYLVGGCVRDLLLDLKPKDFDIGTSATPRQIKRLFRNCRIIGRRFRLAHIYFQNGKIIEVATFRARDGDEMPPQDGKASDLMIRDDNQFGTAEEDALRRDFTINALFYDINAETVLDHADGLPDLRRRVVRTIGDPELRFREDPIRILRAIKFAARLDFAIEPATLDALRRTRGEIPKAASPRVLEEINRFCRGGAARRSFELLRQTEVFEIILGEFTRAYGDRPAAWKLLFGLFDAVDARQRKGHLVNAGGILAVLLIPALVEHLAWRQDGTAEQPKGLNVREITDALMRPVALRLRVSRKDQEHCRLILMSLFRMVPTRRLGRNTKRSILRRECLPDALWILAGLAEELGGDFAEARTYWEQAASAAEPAQAQGARAAAGRPRRRRGGRRRSSKAAPASRTTARGERPKQIDDDYFFTALPSVPEMPSEKGAGDRYGGPGRGAASEQPAQARPGSTGSRRRRRPRRRKRSSAADKGSGESQ